MASRKVKLTIKPANLAKFANTKTRGRGVFRQRKRSPDSTAWPRKKLCTDLGTKKLGGDGVRVKLENEQIGGLDEQKIEPIEPTQIKVEDESVPANTDEGQLTRRTEALLPARLIDWSYDPVIEQWYADPYRRQNPESKTFEAARFLTIHDGLLANGYTNRAIRDKLTLYIYSCQGTYKPLPVRRVAQKKKTVTFLEQTNQPVNTISDKSQAFEVKAEHHDNDEDTADVRINVIKSEFTDADFPLNQDDIKPEIAAITNEFQSHGGSRTGRKHTTELPNAPFTRKQAITRIKTCLRLFDMVYGPGSHDLPQPNYASYYLDYMHSPTSFCPRPMLLRTPLRTQGLKSLRRCTYAGELVYTEDSTFGITAIPASERVSEAEMALYDEAYRRRERAKVIEGVEGSAMWDEGREMVFSNGYTEAWKDIAEKRGVIVPRAEGAKARVVDACGEKGRRSRRRRTTVRAHESDSEGDE